MERHSNNKEKQRGCFFAPLTSLLKMSDLNHISRSQSSTHHLGSAGHIPLDRQQRSPAYNVETGLPYGYVEYLQSRGRAADGVPARRSQGSAPAPPASSSSGPPRRPGTEPRRPIPQHPDGVTPYLAQHHRQTQGVGAAPSRPACIPRVPVGRGVSRPPQSSSTNGADTNQGNRLLAQGERSVPRKPVGTGPLASTNPPRPTEHRLKRSNARKGARPDRLAAQKGE